MEELSSLETGCGEVLRSIAMGLGGYLAARSDAEPYASEFRRERREVRDVPEVEAHEIVTILETYGVTPQESAPVIAALQRKPDAWIAFMMRFELGLEPPNPKRALISAGTIGGAYVVDGLIPLAPYSFVPTVRVALGLSVGITLAALAAFGWVKGSFTGTPRVRSAVQTLLVGGTAAAAAFMLARAIG